MNLTLKTEYSIDLIYRQETNINIPTYITLDLSSKNIQLIQKYSSYITYNEDINYICINWDKELIKFLNQRKKEYQFECEISQLRIYKNGFVIYIQNAQDLSIQFESEFYDITLAS